MRSLIAVITALVLAGCTVLGAGIGGAMGPPPRAAIAPRESYQACLERHRRIRERARETSDPAERARVMDGLPTCEPARRAADSAPMSPAAKGAIIGLVLDVAAVVSIVVLIHALSEPQ